MSEPIDFSSCKAFPNDYLGNSDKFPILFNNEWYMLKFGHTIKPKKNNPLQGSYVFTPVSEWLGCHFFSALGIPVQQTLLGTWNGRIVVACKDFIRPLGADYSIVSFKALEKGTLSSSKYGRNPSLEGINELLDHYQPLASLAEASKDRYWDTFVVDAIIGNFDRHSGNWGYLQKNSTRELVALAPVYDCGSSFAPMLDETAMKTLKDKPSDLRQRALSFPKAKLEVNGSVVAYHEFLTSPEGIDARRALSRLHLAIESTDFDSIIDECPGISDVKRDFFKATVASRIEAILQPAVSLALKEHEAEIMRDGGEALRASTLRRLSDNGVLVPGSDIRPKNPTYVLVDPISCKVASIRLFRDTIVKQYLSGNMMSLKDSFSAACSAIASENERGQLPLADVVAVSALDVHIACDVPHSERRNVTILTTRPENIVGKLAHHATKGQPAAHLDDGWKWIAIEDGLEALVSPDDTPIATFDPETSIWDVGDGWKRFQHDFSVEMARKNVELEVAGKLNLPVHDVGEGDGSSLDDEPQQELKTDERQA